MRYIFTVADISVYIESGFPLSIDDTTRAFLKEDKSSSVNSGTIGGSSGPALKLSFKETGTLPPYKEEDVRYREPRRIFIGRGRTAATYFSAFPGIPPYACVSRETIRDGYLEVRYLPGSEKYMNLGRNLIPLMDIEATMLEHDRLILHSSLISMREKQQCGILHSSFISTQGKQGYGILFSAPSGTGKSTQAELWKEYKGADILNGDRAAVSRNKESWTAYGLPIAGTSGIYRNESTPLRCIVALRQAETNRIRRIKGAEAYRYLYPETMIHRWDDAFEKKAGELLSTLIQEVPVLLLECRPDREAVELLEKTLREL